MDKPADLKELTVLEDLATGIKTLADLAEKPDGLNKFLGSVKDAREVARKHNENLAFSEKIEKNIEDAQNKINEATSRINELEDTKASLDARGAAQEAREKELDERERDLAKREKVLTDELYEAEQDRKALKQERDKLATVIESNTVKGEQLDLEIKTYKDKIEKLAKV